MIKGGYSSRKKWDTGEVKKELVIEQPKSHVEDKYENYLLHLQQKNRVIKKLKTKDDKQKDLERKENGFTLYLNGANQALTTKQEDSNKTQPRAKTARDKDKSPAPKEYTVSEELSRRTKTAPERNRRKNWCAESHEIKTFRGEKVRARAGISTGLYKDDFEVGESVSTQATYSHDFLSESEHSSDVTDSSDTEVEEDITAASINDNQMNKQRSQRTVKARGNEDNDGDLSIEARRYKVSKQKRKDGVEGQGGEQLMLSIKDVKKLRQSLEMNESIRQSIARQQRRQISESDGGGSPIAEVEEELESSSASSSEAEIVEEDDPHNSLEAASSVSHNRKVKFRPKDVIVLEFDGDSKNKGQKSERQLSAARKGDPSSFGALKEERRPTPRDRPLSASKKAPPVREMGGANSPRVGTPAGKQGILANKKPTPVKSTAKNDVFMQPAAASSTKKSRPLSANRKSNTASNLDSTIESRAVIEAMQRENESLKDRQKTPQQPAPQRPTLTPRKTPTPRQSKSAPGQTNGAHEDISPKATRKETHSSQEKRENKQLAESLLDLEHLGDVDKIVAKVLKLDPRGQRRLLKALAQIEDGIDLRDSHVRKSKSENKARKSQSTKPTPVANKRPDEPIEVHLELLSNWGHSSRIGLTEIQIFDLAGRRIELTEKDVMVRNVEEPRGEVMNLFNGKCKTTKERNMMNCIRDKREPVEMLIVVTNADRVPDFGISKIKIWNYNRTLLDLNMGVRKLRISVDNRVVYEGELEKGCANQVFDYANTIRLVDTDSSDSPRDQNTPKSSSATNTPPPEAERPKSKPASEVVLPLDLLNQPSEYDDPRESQRDYDPKHWGGKANNGVSNGMTNDNGHGSDTRKDGNAKPSLAPQPIKNTSEAADRPSESLSTPRQRHRKKKDRKSMMAARLDGSSDMDASASMSNSVDQSQEKVANDVSEKQTTEVLSPRKSSRSNIELTPRQNENNKSRGDKEVAAEKVKAEEKPKLTVVDKMKEEALSVPRPSSGLGGTSDDECMLQQLQKLNIREELGDKKVPQWLQDEQRESKKRNKKDDQLLDNLPKPPSRGKSHLKTDFDFKEAKGKSNSGGAKNEPRKSGASINSRNNRNVSATQNPPASSISVSKSGRLDTKLDIDDDFDIDKEVEVEMSKMQQIESARAQWRKEEENKLEASWNALTRFDRTQKTRLSLDLEDDILDEYLNTERTKPKVATIQEEPEIDDVSSGGDEFVIPELPKGRNMVINIKTTWGDRHYVGLNGVDIFTNTGEMANIESIRAEPSDINILPDYENDPRVVTNLIDGINRTRDDTHMWLAPYNKDKEHQVFITFSKPTSIAMMRIWNYNKSRIHSYRGAKDVQITLDGELIFKGEVARACGGIVGGSEAFGDTILFTMDEDILEEVANHDQAFEADLSFEEDNWMEEEQERPKTADKAPEMDASSRPFTAAANQMRPIQNVPTTVSTHLMGDSIVIKGKCLKLDFTGTWGDPHYLGLTGLEVVGRDGSALPLTMRMLHADPRDLHVLPGYERDDRTLDKLIDGNNVTRSDEHMWMIPFTEGESHLLQITFDQPVDMTGLRIWNYNKSAEDTYRGAKFVHITLDERAVSPPDGFLIRKGPGNCYFDFAQEISFTEPCTPRISKPPAKPSQSMAMDDATQEYEVVQKPCGFIYQLQLLSTHGDQYYVGLNGIEFYDSVGSLITLTENNISAHPHSVNDLPGVENDMRTPDKMIDGNHDTHDGGHMWLAPILPGVLNRIYVIFDEPMEISIIKIWNYSKTESRGVKDFALLVDDLLVYNGTLEPSSKRGILPHVDGPVTPHTIVFTDDRDIRHKQRGGHKRSEAGEQDVQLLNDRKIMAQYGNPNKQQGKPVDQDLRPKTSVTRGGFGKRR